MVLSLSSESLAKILSIVSFISVCISEEAEPIYTAFLPPLRAATKEPPPVLSISTTVSSSTSQEKASSRNGWFGE